MKKQKSSIEQRNLVLVGSVPPPYHGQAIMTEIIYKLELRDYHVDRINIKYSSELEDVGNVSIKKIITLIGIIKKLVRLGGKRDHAILYYCAGSANLAPLIRDALILGCVARFFPSKIIHFHSGGLPEAFQKSLLKRVFGHIAYSSATISIALTNAVPVPCYKLGKAVILPNGLDVPPPKFVSEHLLQEKKPCEFLFVGSLRCSKGVLELIKAAEYLIDQSVDNFTIKLVGEWASKEEQILVEKTIAEGSSKGYVITAGKLVGEDKWQAFDDADVFVFPTYYEAENQPLVVIEAMGKSLPIISTNWRGIPEMIANGQHGIVIEPRDTLKLAEAMKLLLHDIALRKRMGLMAGERYKKEFNANAFRVNFMKILERV